MIGLGKYIFAIPFLIFGIFHFMNADAMGGMAPGGSIMVYISGLGLILAAISIFIGKLDKLACVLLALLLLLFIILIHAPGLGDEATMQNSMSGLLKDMGLLGGALMAASKAKDNSVIG
ncbi:MAG: DoxX family protein [Saprospiraceae bacterium]|nr:DoxX family protein [Saprospiraceae bacterium]